MTTIEHTVPPEDLMAYVDGELPAAQAATIEAHVAGCRACQATVTELRQVSDDLAHWSIQPPRPGAAPRVRAGAWQWLDSLRSFKAKPLAQFAVVGLVLVVGTTVWFQLQIGYSDRLSERKGPVAAASEIRETALEPAAPTVTGGGGAGIREQSGAVSSRTRPALGGFAGGALAAQGAAPGDASRSNVIRTANLTLVTKTFDAVRPAIERMLRDAGGFVGQIQVSGGRGDARTLTASLRVPSVQLDATLATLRGLGQVTTESQGGEDVTTQMIDLEARLKNSRNTENRLTDVLKNRTGKVGDVLEVEREIGRVRGEIEQLDGERKRLQDRVSYATVAVTVNEERQASIDTGTLTFRAQLRNALVDGVQVAYESAAGALLVLLRIAPLVALWAIVLWWPVRRAVRTLQTPASR